MQIVFLYIHELREIGQSLFVYYTEIPCWMKPSVFNKREEIIIFVREYSYL